MSVFFGFELIFLFLSRFICSLVVEFVIYCACGHLLRNTGAIGYRSALKDLGGFIGEHGWVGLF